MPQKVPRLFRVVAVHRRAVARTGPVSTLLEWDEDLPSFEDLAAEAEKARAA